MNLRPFFILSLALNLTLGSLWFYLSRPQPPAPLSPPLPVSVTPAAPTVTPLPVVAGTVTNRVVSAFRWTQVATNDLKAYRDNLRGLGCPERTVRDIIIAEINQRFFPRRRIIFADLQNRFWDTAARGDQVFQTKLAHDYQALVAERSKLIEDILGPENMIADEATVQGRRRRHLQSYSWLPADKREQLMAAEDEGVKRRADLTAQAQAESRDVSSPEFQKQLEALSSEQIQKRKQILTPEENDEFELRKSSAARWPQDLAGFQPTEDEWRAVAKVRRAADQAREQLQLTGLSPADQTARSKEMEIALDKTIQQTLGPDRVAAYELANSPSYQQARRITQRYGLGDDLASKAYFIQEDADKLAKEVRSSSALSAEDQQSALAAIRRNAETSLSATMGQQVFGTFQKYRADWLNQLSQDPSPSPP